MEMEKWFETLAASLLPDNDEIFRLAKNLQKSTADDEEDAPLQ